MIVALFPLRLQAAPQLYSIDFSSLKRGDVAEVVQAIDATTIQLHDGRFVRLIGVESPDYDHENPGMYALLARDILNDMLGGQSVRLYITKDERRGRENRMGMTLAHVERLSDRLWAQGTLLQLGLVRVRSQQSNPEMAKTMYEIEQAARKDEIGIWGEEAFKVLPADKVDGHEGRTHVVEGRVMSASLKNNRVYLNFGSNWRTDFTVTIEPEDRRGFSRAGIDPLQLQNKVVRVRGWVDSYNGPYIQVDHPEAIEVITPASSADDSAGKKK